MKQLDDVACSEEIAEAELDQIQSRLRLRLGGRIRNLRLMLKDRGIILRGLARTYYAKQLAQHAVMSESALPILTNEIVVV